MAAWTVRDARRLRVLVGAVIVSAILPVVVAMHQVATGQFLVRDGFRAIHGPFTHPNYFAFYLVVVLTLGLVALLETRSLMVRVPLGALLALCLVCLLETYTRGAWIGFSAAVLLLGALRYKGLFVAGLVGVVLAAFAFPGSVHKVEQRFGDLASRAASKSGDSWSWRSGQWKRMLRYGDAKPLTGQGFASYSRLTVVEYGTEDPHHPTVSGPAHRGRSAPRLAAPNDHGKMYLE